MRRQDAQTRTPQSASTLGSVRYRATLVLIASALLAAGCVDSPDRTATADPSPPVSDSTIEDSPVLRLVPDLQRNPPLRQDGSAAIDITAPNINRGTLGSTPGWDGQPAVRFPPYSSGDYPRAVVVVHDASEDGQDLNPGERSFLISVDVAVNGHAGRNEYDNGDNVVQRGLATDPAQYKIEIDNRYPRCTVKGDEGAVSVKADLPVTPFTWYRLTCRRPELGGLLLTVSELSNSGSGESWEYVGTGQTGNVTLEQGIALSIGGKVNISGLLVPRSTDQFNGSLMYPTLVIEDGP